MRTLGGLDLLVAPEKMSAAALLRDQTGRYLLQLREDRPSVDYPGWWGLFGGAAEMDETPEEALRRELREELSLCAPVLTYRTQVAWDSRPEGLGVRCRTYFSATLSADQVAGLVLGEGAAMRWFAVAELPTLGRMIPTDLMAIVVHEGLYLHETARAARAENDGQ